MSEINSFSDYASKYNTNVDYSYLSNENMLSKIGITVGKGNKLELDEETLKKADISSFKTLFTGHNSFADKVSMKANSISNAAARTSGTYKSNGTYNNALSELVSKKVDEEV